MAPKQAIKNFKDAAEFLQEQAKKALEHNKHQLADNFQKLAKHNIAMAKWWEVIYGDGDDEVGTTDDENLDPGGQPPIPPPPPPPPIG